MTASFILTLDTVPPANPMLLINGGAEVTGDWVVLVTIFSADFGGGARDVTSMKLWGDVDNSSDPLIQTSEAASAWQSFASDRPVMLSPGSGRKTVYAKLRDDVGNETLTFSDFIDLNLDAPVVQVVTGLDRGKVSKIAPFSQASLSWQANTAFERYEVRVVPQAGSPHQAGVLIPNTFGSANTTGSGAFPAYTPITTFISGGDLEVASPGNTSKIIKIFVQKTGGMWSP